MATFYLSHSAELYHYGVLGMKWGVRRYQNVDGSLTAAGQKRYGSTGKRRLTRDEKKDLKSTKKKLAGLYETAEYAGLRYLDEERNYERLHKKAVKAQQRGRSISEKQAAKHNRASMRAEFYTTLNKKNAQAAIDAYKSAIEKYGSKRIKDIPIKHSKYGDYVYRKYGSTPADKAWLGLAIAFGGGAIGGAIAGTGAGIQRAVEAKAYGRDIEKAFERETGHKIDDPAIYQKVAVKKKKRK